MGRIIMPGEFYRHFKNNLYQIITVATHSETKEKMVVYQALYGDFKTYVRPYDMFVSEVDHIKYPDVEQKYRFERVLFEETKKEEPIQKEEETLIQTERKEEQINPYLLQFLDAETYHDKLEVLENSRTKLDETAIHSMAVSMDFTLTEGTIDEKVDSLIFYLRTLMKYQCNRLR